MRTHKDRGISPVVGAILIIAVTIILSTVAISTFLLYTGSLEESSTAYIEIDEDNQDNKFVNVVHSGTTDKIILIDSNGESILEVGNKTKIDGEYAIYGYKNGYETLLEMSDEYSHSTTLNNENEESEEELNFESEPEDLDEILNNMRGDGSESSPYIITNIYELQAIDADLDSYYELGNNIDASYTQSWSNGFDPIGDSSGTFNSNSFDGSLDGNSYSITGIDIDRPSEDRTAIFSGIGSGSTVENVVVQDANVRGNIRTAVLIGESWGTVTNIGIESSTVSGDERVGGLIANSNGGFAADSVIQNTYVKDTSITGTDRVGGISGRNYQGDIIESYSTTKGISGDHDDGWSTTISNIYYESYGSDSIGVELSESEMQGSSAEINMDGFDFDSTWVIVDNDYPKLRN